MRTNKRIFYWKWTVNRQKAGSSQSPETWGVASESCTWFEQNLVLFLHSSTNYYVWWCYARFVMKTVLKHWYGWAGLVQWWDLSCLPPQPTSKGAGDAQGVGRGHSQNRWPEGCPTPCRVTLVPRAKAGARRCRQEEPLHRGWSAGKPGWENPPGQGQGQGQDRAGTAIGTGRRQRQGQAPCKHGQKCIGIGICI